MKTLDPEIVERLTLELKQLRYKHGNNLFEWSHINYILDKDILPVIHVLIRERIENLELENKELRSRINQLSFGNNPERDKKITELFNSGFSMGKIAQAVGMSKWGVSKALCRLGVT